MPVAYAKLSRLVTLAIVAIAAGASIFAASVRSAGAQDFVDGTGSSELPPALRDWVSWAVDGDETYGCSRVASGFRCVWPGRLDLALGAQGGRFSERVVTDRRVNAPIPGKEGQWPQNVTVDGEPWPVVAGDSGPVVRLGPGSHRIEGTFSWREMPEVLRVPPEIALVDLSLDGTDVPSPRRDEDGTLWLRGRQRTDLEEHAEVEVFRRIQDGVPIRVETELAVRASGRARELDLGRVLLPGALPTDIRSELPVRLGPDGAVVLQVHAGTFSLRLTSVLPGAPEAVTAPEVAEPWPSQETWVWAADEELRQVRVSGASSIDPARTNLPTDWRDLPAYAVRQGESLELATVRRGQPTPPPNQLELERELWLALDGGSYTVRDRLHGTMHQSWRLELDAEELGHVTVGGVDQVITEHGDRPGIELRDGNVDVRAEWRTAGDVRDISAVAWSEDVQRLSTTVRLPPGWTLATVVGADNAPGTWVEDWDLFGLFFVLLVSLAMGRLYGWPWAMAALLFLSLSYHEAHAPLGAWVAVLVFLALARHLPAGWPSRIAGGVWWMAALFLLIFVAIFATRQTRFALYPQLGDRGDDSFEFSDPMAFGLAAAPPAMEPEALEEPMIEADYEDVDGPTASGGAPAGSEELPSELAPAQAPTDANEDRRTASPRRRESSVSEYGLLNRLGSGDMDWSKTDWVDPNAIIQTGPGIPDWNWREWHLSWSGPVTKEQRLHLWLLSPSVNRLLSLLRAVLGLALLVLVFVRRPRRRPPSADRTPATSTATAGAAAIAGLIITFGAPYQAHAQTGPVPSPELLQELRTRVTRPPACAPDCVSTDRMKISVANGRLIVEARVSSGTLAALPIPGPSSNWVPANVSVDGTAADGLALLDEGFLYLRLAPGPHVVRVEGPLARDSLTLAFGVAPHHLEVDAEGWEVEGVHEDGRTSDSVQLRRVLQSADAAHREDQLPAWLAVTRTLQIGVRWTLRSSARRLTDGVGPALVRVPLLPGESVTESDLLVENDHVVVSLGGGDEEVSWTSVLAPRSELTLTAPSGVRWSETWILRCSPIWRCEPSGIAPTSHRSGGRWEPSFRPWPGEELTIRFVRPEATEGRSTTIDSAKLVLTPGSRLLRARLETRVRTSSGGPHSWSLPDDARVQSLTIDGRARPIQRADGGLTATLRPGTQTVEVLWQQPLGLGRPSQVRPCRWVPTPSTHGSKWRFPRIVGSFGRAGRCGDRPFCSGPTWRWFCWPPSCSRGRS